MIFVTFWHGHFAFCTVFATFGHVCLSFCMVFVIFRHFNLWFAWYYILVLQTFMWVSWGFFRLSFRVSCKVSFRVSLGFHSRVRLRSGCPGKILFRIDPLFPPYRARPKPRFLDVNTQTPSRKPVLSNENPLWPNRHLTRFDFHLTGCTFLHPHVS